MDKKHESIPKHILQPLFTASNSSPNLEECLSRLTEIAKTTEGRSDLASKNILTAVLELCRFLSCPTLSQHNILFLSLKLLRNLCAGEIANQNSYIEQNGVRIVCDLLKISILNSNYYGILRMGLQLLGNVSLAGEGHKLAVWNCLFPVEFLEISRIRRREMCDPLCMVIYSCSQGNNKLTAQIRSDEGLIFLAEIVRTASTAGYEEDWFKLLVSMICIEESQFAQLFSTLCPVDESKSSDDVSPRSDLFVPEQAFLLSIVSEILNERVCEIVVSTEFVSCVLRILKSAIFIIDSISTNRSGLPTGTTDIDVLGYSLTILRDICALDSPNEAVNSLISSDLLDLLLNILNDLEPPSIVKKSSQISNNSGKKCPYKGFRRDVVAIIGNCAYRRKKVQDLIREKNGILLMLQQCVVDEANPFLREWGIWSVRNLLEGNLENQQLVSDLEIQGSVDIPEITRLGLRVEVDQNTRRAKLVNVSSN